MAYDDMKKLVDLDMLDKYHKTIVQDNLGGSASVSTIKITTSEASLNGKEVTITDGVETLTGTFVGGSCTFKKVKLVGLLTISSTDGETIAQTTLDVQSYGIHTVNLTFKYVLLNITTSEQMLYGQKVTAYLDGIEAGAVTLSGEGAGQIRVEETGKYTLRASASGFKAVAEVTASAYFETYNVSLALDYATINVSTTEPTLVGKVVRVANLGGNTIATGVFSDTGTATIYTDQYGNYTVSATDGDYTAQSSITVASGGVLTVELRFEYSTIHVATTDPLLAGATINVKKSGTTIASGTFESGSADIYVHETGSVTVETTAEGFTASESVNVAEFFQTYNVTLNLSYATLNISTSEPALFGKNVLIGTVQKTLGSGGTLTYYTNTTGAVTVSATDDDGNQASTSVTVSAMGTTQNVVLSFYHLTVTTTEDTLEGKTVSITQGTNVKSATFSEKRADIVFGMAFLGDCTITSTDGTDTANGSIMIVAGTYTYTTSISFSVTYSVILDLSKSDPSGIVEYADDATGIAKGWSTWKTKDIFKDIKPCVLKDGEVLYYLNPDNYAQKADGTAADITTLGNDVMIEFPYRIGYKFEWQDTGKTKLKVSVTNRPDAEGFCYDAFSMNASNDCDRAYIGAYKAHNNGNKLYSSSGKAPAANITIGNFRTYAQARGTGYFQKTWGLHTLWQCLYVISHGTLDSQSAVARGYVDGNSAAINTGGANALGFNSELMTSSQKTGGKTQVKCLGVEDAWGNVFEWVDGLVSGASYNVLSAKYASQFNDTGAGYNNNGDGGVAANVSGYMTNVQGTSGSGFVARVASGSESVSFCDYGALAASRVAYAGGHWNTASYAGAFYLYVSVAASSSYANLGARICYLHKEVKAPPPGLDIVTWADGTDAQLAAMIDAHKNGDISLYDYWHVGDTRTVSLSAMAATGVSESHVAQDVEIVLTDKDVYELANGSGNCIFTWDLKNCLANGTSPEQGYMNSTNTNNGGWNGSARRTWCNNVFYNALPASFRALVPQVKIKASAGNKSSTITTSNDYCFLRSEIEVVGTTSGSFTGEGSQIEYYKTSANRIKKAGANGNAFTWWERSPRYNNAGYFCTTYNSSTNSDIASAKCGLAPCGCI